MSEKRKHGGGGLIEDYFTKKQRKSNDSDSPSTASEREYLLNDPTGCIWLASPFLSRPERTTLFNQLVALDGPIKFKELDVVIYGKSYKQPRMVAFVAGSPLSYSYSGLALFAQPWPDSVARLCQRVNDVCNTNFNSCLLNLYRNGSDNIGWHSDNERELGVGNAVAGVSLGGVRMMHFRSTQGRGTFRVQLLPGSLILMSGMTQGYYQHSIPKTKRAVGVRLSLTFRTIKM